MSITWPDPVSWVVFVSSKESPGLALGKISRRVPELLTVTRAEKVPKSREEITWITRKIPKITIPKITRPNTRIKIKGNNKIINNRVVQGSCPTENDRLTNTRVNPNLGSGVPDI